MTPGKLNLTLYRGDTYHWKFTLWTDAAKTVPADLTGATVKAQIRTKPASTLIATLTCVITLPNIIAMNLAAADSAKLTASGGAWDLQVTYPMGDVMTVLAGSVRVTMDVTDSAASTMQAATP